MSGKTQKQLIQEVHQGMYGVPGTDDRGLMGDMRDMRGRINGLGTSHGRLKRNFWILVGILTGLGVLGGSTYGWMNGI